MIEATISWSQSLLLNEGGMLFDISAGLRGSFSSHSTPQLSFNGLIAGAGGNDRIVFSPMWNLIGSFSYSFSKKPIVLGISSGIQTHENVHFAGIYRWNDDFRPKRLDYKTFSIGFSSQYDVIRKNKHHLGFRLGVNVLLFPQNLSDFKEGYGFNYGHIISKNQLDTIQYSTAINSISTRANVSFQLDFGINYKYFIAKSIFFQLNAIGQLGLTNLVNSSAVFINSSNPSYTGNSSFSVNKGDGLLLNAGIGYRLPIKKTI